MVKTRVSKRGRHGPERHQPQSHSDSSIADRPQLTANEAFRQVHAESRQAEHDFQLHDSAVTSLQRQIEQLQTELAIAREGRAEAEARRERVREELEALCPRLCWRLDDEALMVSVFTLMGRRDRKRVATTCSGFNKVMRECEEHIGRVLHGREARRLVLHCGR